MPASGSCIFTDADGYGASLQDMLDLVVGPADKFSARLTWVELPILRLLRARETAPRLAYVSLPHESVFVTFPTQPGSLLICDGMELPFGDIMFHSRGQRFHQRTIVATSWGAVSLPPASLAAFSRTLTGRELVAPAAGRVLRPRVPDRVQLLRLHAQVGRVAETQLDHIVHPQVARALEQDLIWALVTCLTTGEPRDEPAARHEHAAILAELETLLASNPERALTVSEVCRVIGVSHKALKICCGYSIGMGPARYLRLRRLKHMGVPPPYVHFPAKGTAR